MEMTGIEPMPSDEELLVTLEGAREIRKHQTFLDPYPSADRENAMILVGAKAQLAKAKPILEKEKQEAVKQAYNKGVKESQRVVGKHLKVHGDICFEAGKKQEREKIAKFATRRYIDGIGYVVITWEDWQALKGE